MQFNKVDLNVNLSLCLFHYIMEMTGFMTYTASSHLGAIETLWFF